MISDIDNITFNGNDTIHHQLYKSPFAPFLVGSSVLSLISNMICTYFLIYKLTLNAYIKSIYYLMNCLNIIILIGSLGAQSYILQTHQQTLLSCFLILFSEITGILFNIEMSSMISITKFYMGWKASKARIAKPKAILSIIIFSSTYFGLSKITLLILSFYFKMRSSTTLCANQHDFNQNPYYAVPLFLELIIILLIGLSFDVSMYFFVEKRKKSTSNGEKANIIPWKVTAKKEEAGIPQKTTLMTFSTLVFFLITVAPSMYFVIIKEESSMWFPATIFTLWIGFQLPCLLFVTIKHQNENIVKKQPPQALQFHDDVEPISNDVEQSCQMPPRALQFHDDEETMSNDVEQSCEISTVSNQVMSIRILPED